MELQRQGIEPIKPKADHSALTGTCEQWENARSKMGSGRGAAHAHHEEGTL